MSVFYDIWEEPPMTTPKQSDEQHQDQAATSEDDDLMEADVSIPASFDEVMKAVIDGYGTHRSGPDSTILERKGKR